MDRVLTTPISEKDARALRAGDVIYVSGTMFTARDEAHKMMLERGSPLPVEGLALFHCGPVAQKVEGRWQILAAGPTTSARMELFEADFLRKFKTRIIVGKGGMGDKTLAALGEVGAVYTHFTGGAGALAAKAVKRVAAVHWLEELGMPEAIWVMEVERFGPLVVAMDSHGKSLYKDLAVQVEANMKGIRARIRS
ncbi:MAG: fumarate hydratase C-terminal domain-containing protein [Candidatus Bipolaricaulis sp.]|jgi:tartrate/fumarate subfamily iron-sulfur-dependent hydro-lyase beta chain|uniref:FumA C-terminus/TtdB family hydratase beta subunit n=1 Tax=Candidatus Bipolaricaulis anaerobius TaxID=2026885 RepID=UPI000EFCCC25|nr:FumA C-terminus/TtdB family hydratase beta subunit [Candidatus Bipolaricaulis anaerobius]MBP7726184.1 fumarate hydratase C-terminal domain-containing protein [Candidatus Bipolaricaulis sp.]MDD2912106.1 FumA C-terminus/TtdB family hydratase beta subunit [Candidatus Bipolaricaulis anaerobius]HQM38411.1 FumA C-terminus/TtdB family hydratase beta subunit [Candidatus Bipolaricaulis anaerobius]